MTGDLPARLRTRATAFNDAGLRYGVADLLTEAAERIDNDAATLTEDLAYQRRLEQRLADDD